ncbi:MAG: 3'(2'),5'-bisphosphate nucleotidase CysQ [Desulfobacterales bacterium]|nr:3'(2'),5'-bisphosphate nucleotidase CysQ [Desulfobacterales bacterium]
MSDLSLDSELVSAISVSLDAGRAILDVYQSDFAVEEKDDRSPLTLADQRAHEIIVATLEKTPHPILSEEGQSIPYRTRRDWKTFWLVDPLDGTKEFIKRNGEFTVNIALIQNHRPVLGVIYVPVADTLYFGTKMLGAYKTASAFKSCREAPLDSKPPQEAREYLIGTGAALPLHATSKRPFTIVGSRSHSTPDVDRILAETKRIHGQVEFISAGSSLKICMVAEGRADLYPRTGPTMEWDTGAGQAIAQAAGAEVVEFHSQAPLRYNKENLLNPWFRVQRP